MKRIWRTLVYEFKARVFGITPRGDCRVCGHAWHGNVLIGGGVDPLVAEGFHVLIPSYRCKKCTHNEYAVRKNATRSLLLKNRRPLSRVDDGAQVVLWPKEEVENERESAIGD